MSGPGAYGKMPALGDFMRIAPPAGFVEPWDRWLQDGMTAAKRRLGARWQECFLTAPIWRFTLGPGLAGTRGVWGVLMPSVDRVGRLFPLTLAAPLPAGTDPVKWHFSVATVFEELEEIALDALSDTMTRERLAARLDACAPPARPAQSTAGREGAALLLQEPPGGAALAGLAARLTSERYARPTVWSQTGEAGTQILLDDGLPPPDRMHLLFDPAGNSAGQGERSTA